MKPCEGFKISGSQHAWNVKPFWCYNMRYANLHSPSMESVWPCRAASNKWSEVFSNYNGKNKISKSNSWEISCAHFTMVRWLSYPSWLSQCSERGGIEYISPLLWLKVLQPSPSTVIGIPPPHNVDKPNVRRWLTDASIRTLSFIFARPNLVIPSTSP